MSLFLLFCLFDLLIRLLFFWGFSWRFLFSLLAVHSLAHKFLPMASVMMLNHYYTDIRLCTTTLGRRYPRDHSNKADLYLMYFGLFGQCSSAFCNKCSVTAIRLTRSASRFCCIVQLSIPSVDKAYHIGMGRSLL